MISKVEKAKLVDILTKNKAEHEALLKEAVAGYEAAVTKGLAEISANFAATKKLDLSPITQLTSPQSFVKQYEEALAMLEHTTEDIISLEYEDFRSYVLDKWTWMRQFGHSSGMYLSSVSNSVISSKSL